VGILGELPAFVTEVAMQRSDAAEAVASAYYVLQLLPLDPDQAEAILAMVERALRRPDLKPDGWSEPASYVFSHLQKRKPETAAATVAVARDIIQAIRPHFT
jgi:glutathione S-transferase